MAKRVVVKVGSSLLTGETDILLDRGFIAKLCNELSELKQKGEEIILVTSGAIIAGVDELKTFFKREQYQASKDGKFGERAKPIPLDLRKKQAAAAIGQIRIMQVYREEFGKKDIHVAQVLLTREDFEERHRYLNARNTLLTLLDAGVIPIINENDTVAVEEIQVGDNDNLSAIVASKVGADYLIILTDVQGLYTDDPTKNKNAEIIPEVKEITPGIEILAGKNPAGERGTGGMLTKIQAAKIATRSGVTMVRAHGKKEKVIQRILNGERIGTRFLPQEEGLKARDRWIAFGMKAKGKIYIDQGAVDALVKKGKSLLPSGITSVEGKFDIGEMVSIFSPEEKEIARGLTYYSAEEIEKIKGKRSQEIEKILKHKDYDEVIHRDNLVLL
ncbi:MAG TPA: glutamate 5-kinase [Elusimicrobia bacterium]|nr:glutamate 5-kinase [Elusimicrobiota bacterium]